jgi:hypothetical protein
MNNTTGVINGAGTACPSDLSVPPIYFMWSALHFTTHTLKAATNCWIYFFVRKSGVDFVISTHDRGFYWQVRYNRLGFAPHFVWYSQYRWHDTLQRDRNSIAIIFSNQIFVVICCDYKMKNNNSTYYHVKTTVVQ